MAIIPSTFKLDWYDPSQPGGVTSDLNDNANTATSNATQYTMEDIINTVSYTGGSIDGSGAQYALPVFTDTNTITNLPLGAAGEMLTSGGAGVDPAWAAAPATGPYEIGAGTDSAQLIAGTNAADGEASVVAGGVNNCIPSGTTDQGYSTISGGCGNYTQGYDDGKGKGGGQNVISGGCENCVNASFISVIGGGGGNVIDPDTVFPGVGNASYGSTVSGGLQNRMLQEVAGGKGDMFGTIAGGSDNTIYGSTKESSGNVISGGEKNTICENGKDATIGGGGDNLIHALAGDTDGSFIGGGFGNQIVSGKTNVISGGMQNCICASENSFIGGGEANDSAGFDNVHILGSNITATRTDTSYVEGFNIGQATPITAYADNAAALLGGLTIGDVYRQTTTAGGDLLGIVH